MNGLIGYRTETCCQGHAAACRINRPIVVTPSAVKLCRPSGSVPGIPPDPRRGAFAAPR